MYNKINNLSLLSILFRENPFVEDPRYGLEPARVCYSLSILVTVGSAAQVFSFLM